LLSAALLVVAFTAGVAGTWSPCGFSMIGTISDPRRRVALSSAAFGVGACVGGVATFGLLALVGAALGLRAPLAVALVGAAAATAEVRRARIAPQIRRQVPEHWRRLLPLPFAAFLYGVLLGMGFTTFVYTFALWALAALVLIVGAPLTGALCGLAFGVGRALPVVLLAPIAHRALGSRLVDAMAQRPVMLSLVRVSAAAALTAVVVAALAGSASGATNLGTGSDPSASGTTVVWTTPDGGIRRDESTNASATAPARAVVGGLLLAWRDGTTVHVVRLADSSPVLDVDVPGVTAVAISDGWLVTRAATPTGEVMSARDLSAPTVVTAIGGVQRPMRLGRPSLDGDLVVYHVAAKRTSSIVAVDLATGTRRVLRRSTSNLLTNPSALGGELVYDRLTRTAQLVQVGPLDRGGTDRTLYRLGAPSVHDLGHERGYSRRTRTRRPRTANWRLWTTALSAQRVYVTLLPRSGAASAARLVSIAR
jgi:MFS family permease